MAIGLDHLLSLLLPLPVPRSHTALLQSRGPSITQAYSLRLTSRQKPHGSAHLDKCSKQHHMLTVPFAEPQTAWPSALFTLQWHLDNPPAALYKNSLSSTGMLPCTGVRSSTIVFQRQFVIHRNAALYESTVIHDDVSETNIRHPGECRRPLFGSVYHVPTTSVVSVVLESLNRVSVTVCAARECLCLVLCAGKA